MEVKENDIINKWIKSYDARSEELSKYSLIDVAYREYQKHLKQGEDWGSSFRFPELFGSIERKVDSIIQILPEARVKGDDDGAIAKQHALDYLMRMSNIRAAKNRAMWDVPFFGMGVLFVVPTRYTKTIKDKGGKQKQVLLYDGLGSERVDPRDILPAYSAYKLHDHTGMEYCPYVFRTRQFYYDTFIHKYQNIPGFDKAAIKSVVPTTWYGGAWMDQKVPTTKESTEKGQAADYVTVIEYWDQENDVLRIYANTKLIFDSPDGIPYSHKQIPFHFYYNYRRYDSIAGVSEVELIQPYNLFRETVLNLMIDNIKLELQPAYVVDGNVSFNEEEHELEPGAIFTLSGTDGGKLQDHIMPYRVGGVTQDVFQVVQAIDDSYIASTGDDRRALQNNPNQLATQTLAKHQALQKRTLNQLIRNTSETEWYLTYQICSYIDNEFAEPYENEDGEIVNRKVEAEGYNVIQDKDESVVEFKKAEGTKSYFYLNKKVSGQMDDKEIEIVPAFQDDEIRQEKYQSIMMFLQSIVSLITTNPEAYKEIVGNMDVKEFIRQIAEDLKMDTPKLFPPEGQKKEDYDIIDIEHEQIMMSMNPAIKEDEDSMTHYTKHIEFMQGVVYKKAGKKVQLAMKDHLKDTMINIVTQTKNAGQQVQEAGQVPTEPGKPNGIAQAEQQTPVQSLEESSKTAPRPNPENVKATFGQRV